ncbi:unnamed protein product [Taenia asiatica]|uniref:TIR domain-containing protein n=1 Tax=Taenia asiatica TaxID=60517 RepID=A0A158R7E8_TAEAS|nr:unnamed protein product [Taenia asiatica]
MQYYASSIPDIKSISTLILAYLVTDEQFSRCIKDESIQFVINNILSNFRHQKGPRRSFETPELCLALREMAKTDTSTSRILQCGGIQALGSVLSKGTSREKCAAALALLSLALHESTAAIARVQIRSALINDINAQLTTLRNQMPVSISAEGRRGAIEDMVEDYRSFKSWILERSNLLPEIWLDTQQMHTENDIMDAMAIAVERAFAVCILYSEAYKRCPNTRMEAQYAQKLDKPMIFCRVEQGYLPGGWLGVLTARQTYIDFSGKFAFEDASGELLHRLANLKMSIKSEKAEINVGPS